MTAGFAYDRAGNVLNDGVNDYWYNAEGQLCAVYKLNGTATAYLYDAEGRRVAKGTLSALPSGAATYSVPTTGSCGPITASTSGFTLGSRYLVDLAGDQVTELNGSGNWQHSNVWAGGKLLATWDSTGIHFPLTDPLGTKRIQASNLGTVDLTCISLPFGNGPPCFGPDAPPLGTEHRFTEKERDTETGNDYFGARYYASSMGRFMSPDPLYLEMHRLADPQRLNIYAYGRNNPLLYFDPTGLDDKCVGDRCGDYLTGLQKDVLFKIKYDDNGMVRTDGPVDTKHLSKSDKAFLKMINDPNHHVVINAIDGAKMTNGPFARDDGYDKATKTDTHTIAFGQAALLDQPGNSGGLTSAGLVGHETLEAYEESQEWSFWPAHIDAGRMGFPGFIGVANTLSYSSGGFVTGQSGVFSLFNSDIKEKIMLKFVTPIPMADWNTGKGAPWPNYATSVENVTSAGK